MADNIENEMEEITDAVRFGDYAALVARYHRASAQDAGAYSARHLEEHGHALAWGCCRATGVDDGE